MALIHMATLTPTKLELMTAWAPGRPWFTGTSELRQVGAYRFDDPAGQVGLEGILLATTDGSVLHIPMTYRAAPLAGAQQLLIGTIEHSVLGRRWVYDACGDPVWAAALATTMLTGSSQAEEIVDHGDHFVPREPTVKVFGSGTPDRPVPAIESVTCWDEGQTTAVKAGDLELVVVRVVGADLQATQTLTGRWSEGEPSVLAGLRSE
ncbi:MAG TPA: hypothetical protein VLL08_01200 [Kineosporiaceae bacterium]|nr:hypothetical protein [Kineosporiaceae bacterium]